jgi:hypothetical protein
MKTKTIENLGLLIKEASDNIRKNKILDAIDNLWQSNKILEQEVQRKENKIKPLKLQVKGTVEELFPDMKADCEKLKKTIHELYQTIADNKLKQTEYNRGYNDGIKLGRFPFGLNEQSLFGFETTNTGKIVIINGDLFKPMLDKLNAAYEKQCEAKKDFKSIVNKSSFVVLHECIKSIDDKGNTYQILDFTELNGATVVKDMYDHETGTVYYFANKYPEKFKQCK